MSTSDKIVSLLAREAQTTSQILNWIEEMEGQIIERRGREDGRAAGSWVFDGNTPVEDILATKKGIVDGDPAVLDNLPQPRLSGEFADDPTWERVLLEEGIRYDSEIDAGCGRDELLDRYNDAFTEGVQESLWEVFNLYKHKFDVGDRVVVHGFDNPQQHLNGRQGVVVEIPRALGSKPATVKPYGEERHLLYVIDFETTENHHFISENHLRPRYDDAED